MIADVVTTLLTAAWGLIVLSPLRTRLGRVSYLVLAIPIGVICWSLAAALHTLIAVPFGSILTPAVGTLCAGACAIALRYVSEREIGKPDSYPSVDAAVLLAIATAFTAIASWIGATIVTRDSWFGYGNTAIRLADEGILFVRLLDARAPLLPSISAGYISMGGEWYYTIYPLAAVSVLAALGLFVFESTATTNSRSARIYGVVLALLCVGALPFFVLNIAYAHSHMVTALYMLMAVGAVVLAAQREADAAWLAVTGIACAGIVLARPDGFAYAFAPMAAACIVALRAAADSRRPLLSLWGSFLIPICLVFGSALVRHGSWTTDKLSGALVLKMVGAYLVLAVVTLLLDRYGRTRAFVGRWGMPVLLVAFIVVSAAVLFSVPTAPITAAIMLFNLLIEGQWGHLWFVAPAIVALGGLVFLGNRDQTGVGFSAWTIVGFATTAFVVHAVGHTGHLGWTDSFNRVAFHIVPVLMLCLGTGVTWAIDTVVQSAPSEEATDA